LVLKDRVKETSTTTGTGTLTLGGAATGFRSFAVIGNGNTTYYAIFDRTSQDWEVGVGAYTSSGTTLTRDTVLESSNSGSLVNFGAGNKDVFCTYPAEKAVTLDDVQTLSNKTLASPTVSGNLAFTGTGNRITGDFSNATAANRVSFQSSTVNGATALGVIPNGTSTASSFITNSSSDINNAHRLRFGVDASTAFLVSDVTGTGTNRPMVFWTGGSERVRIDTSGNLGIGTSSPQIPLDVQKSGDAQIRARETGAGVDLRLNAIGGAGLAGIVGTYSNHPVVIYTNTTERMRIDSEGSVAITQTPGRYTIDTTGGATSIANNGTVNFPSASGMLVVNSFSTGAVTIYLCGGGSTTVVANVIAQVGTLTFTPGINGYTWTNNTGSAATFGFFFVRTRPSA
jgi:hypothetical protein